MRHSTNHEPVSKKNTMTVTPLILLLLFSVISFSTAEEPENSQNDPSREVITDELSGTEEGYQTMAFILFSLNSSEISHESDSLLKMVADTLLHYKTITIEVTGHTDNSGNLQFNNKLSILRAEAVQKNLIHKGINAERIRVVGHGMNQPIADNQSREGRVLNRRVRIWQTGK